MFSLLVVLCGGDLLEDVVVEGQVHVEGDAVESLETEIQLVKQQPSLLQRSTSRSETVSLSRCNGGNFLYLVKGADESVSFIKSQQDVHGPFQF